MTPVQFIPRFGVLRSPDPIIATSGPAQPDRRDGAIYDLADELHLAVEVALSTGRPLLLRGDPGCGKSSLAPYVARRLGWRYYEHVVTSQTTATDLLYRYDAVRRLGDAYRQQGTSNDLAYLEPGVLWWAFNKVSAARCGGTGDAPEAAQPGGDPNKGRDEQRAVVLIDEIDKAHPDVPNGLLSVLGSHRIDVPYLTAPVELALPAAPDTDDPAATLSPLLVVITTNNERELPAAFVRRCLVWTVEHPKPPRLVEIARRHFDAPGDPFTEDDRNLAVALADVVDSLRTEAQPGIRRPSTAEFLDAFRACRTAGIRPPHDGEKEDPQWTVVRRLTLAKPDETPW